MEFGLEWGFRRHARKRINMDFSTVETPLYLNPHARVNTILTHFLVEAKSAWLAPLAPVECWGCCGVWLVAAASLLRRGAGERVAPFPEVRRF